MYMVSRSVTVSILSPAWLSSLMIAEMFWKRRVAGSTWPVCAQALQCWFGFVQDSGWDGAGAVQEAVHI